MVVPGGCDGLGGGGGEVVAGGGGGCVGRGGGDGANRSTHATVHHGAAVPASYANTVCLSDPSWVATVAVVVVGVVVVVAAGVGW